MATLSCTNLRFHLVRYCCGWVQVCCYLLAAWPSRRSSPTGVAQVLPTQVPCQTPSAIAWQICCKAPHTLSSKIHDGFLVLRRATSHHGSSLYSDSRITPTTHACRCRSCRNECRRLSRAHVRTGGAAQCGYSQCGTARGRARRGRP